MHFRAKQTFRMAIDFFFLAESEIRSKLQMRAQKTKKNLHATAARTRPGWQYHKTTLFAIVFLVVGNNGTLPSPFK